jgi:hypothetical protein
VISVLSRLTLLMVLIGAAIAPSVRQVAGQGVPTPPLSDLVQPTECTVEPRTADEVYALIDMVLADDMPPTSESGTVVVDDGGLTTELPISMKPVDVSLDGTLWIKGGTVVGGLDGEQSGRPVDDATTAEIKAFLRIFVACEYYSSFLREFALYTDEGLVQRLRYARLYLRTLASIIERSSLASGENILGSPKLELHTIDMRLLPDGRIVALTYDTDQLGDEPIYPVLYLLVREGERWKIDWLHIGRFAPIGEPGATPVPLDDTTPTPLPTKTATPITEDTDSTNACHVKSREPEELYALIDAVIADKQPPASADGGVEVDAGTIDANNPRKSQVPDVRLDGSLWIEDGAILDGSDAQQVDATSGAEVQGALQFFFTCGYPYWYPETFALYTDRGFDQYLRFERPTLRTLASVIELSSFNDEQETETDISPTEYQVLDMRQLADGRVAVLVTEIGKATEYRASPLPWLIVLAKSEGLWKIDWVFYGEFASPEGMGTTLVP